MAAARAFLASISISLDWLRRALSDDVKTTAATDPAAIKPMMMRTTMISISVKPPEFDELRMGANEFKFDRFLPIGCKGGRGLRGILRSALENNGLNFLVISSSRMSHESDSRKFGESVLGGHIVIGVFQLIRAESVNFKIGGVLFSRVAIAIRHAPRIVWDAF